MEASADIMKNIFAEEDIFKRKLCNIKRICKKIKANANKTSQNQ